MADLEKLVNDKTTADALWKEQRQMQRDNVASLRDASVNEITTDPEAYVRYLDMQADNLFSSAGNVALMMIQRPEATLFGTRDRWKSMGRFVLDAKQDQGVKIFTRSSTGRGYILTDAYDLSQTQGREVVHPQLQDDSREMEAALGALLKHARVEVAVSKDLTTAARYDPRTMTLAYDAGDQPRLFGQRGVWDRFWNVCQGIASSI